MIIIKWNINHLLLYLLISIHYLANIVTAKELSPNIIFRHISLEHGLSQSSASDIVQDQRGYIWVATIDGLNRFDGYEFKQYSSDRNNPNSLSDSWINCLLIDSVNNLWIGTRAGGLNKFNQTTHQFTHYKHDPSQVDGLSGNSIKQLVEDNTGIIWIATIDGGLSYYEPQSKNIKAWNKSIANQLSLTDISILSIAFDKHKYLWIGTESNGLIQLDTGTGQIRAFHKRADNANSLTSNSINSIFIENPQNIWLGTNAGLTLFKPQDKQFIHYHHKINNEQSIASNLISTIHKDRNENLWIGTKNAGLDRLNLKTGKIQHFIPDIANPNSISGTEIMAIFEDNNGVIWVGTNSNGLNSFHPNTENFNLITRQTEHRLGLDSLKIFGLLQEHDNLWIATGNYLAKWNRKTNYIKNYYHNPEDKTSINTRRTRQIIQDSKGDIWISGENGLNRYQPDTDNFKRYDYNPNNPHGISHPLAKAMLEDHAGNFWVATFGGGLNLLDRKTGHFKAYMHDPNNQQSISNNSAYSLLEDKDHNLWIGTYGGGLNQFVPEKEIFIRHSEFSTKNSNAIKSIAVIHQDKTGQLWLGTVNGGLEKYDPITRTTISYKEEHGLINNTIYGILEDSTGALWLTTNSGISKFEPGTERFTNYDINDGLQENEFNGGSYLKISDSELMFGGINGLTWFNPKKVNPITNNNTVTITDFFIFNKSVPLTNTALEFNTDQYFIAKPIEQTKEIILSYRENYFGFTFSSFNYQNHRKSKFSYLLEGWDKSWIITNHKNRRASYSNIPSGSYNFRLKSGTGNQDWKEQNSSLKIIILPPPWRSNWAYFSYLAILTCIGYWFIYIQRKKQELQKERQLSSHLKQIDKLKDEFLANTSHELRTPLNGIIGLAESLMDGATGQLSPTTNAQLLMIVNSGQRLANLVNDILDFSKLQKHNLQLQLEPIDIYIMVDMVLTMSRPMIKKQKSLQLINSVDHKLKPVMADSNRLQQIFYNLIGNAIKFTESGTIEITAQECNDIITINIIDTGIGIPEDKLDTVFKYFQQLEGASTRKQGGTGLGLAVTRQLVNLHGGDISVQSEPGAGSTFSFTLPVSKNDTKPREIEKISSLHIIPQEQQANDDEDITTTIYTSGLSYTILIVDDEEINRQVLANYLSLKNYHLLEASSGKQALDIISCTPSIDLVLLDIMMPNMNGYDACRAIRKSYSAEQLPIIFLTAKNQVIDLVESFESGANDYLTKPVSKHELLSRAKLHLQLLESHRTLEKRVQERTIDVENKNRELKALDDIIAAINTEIELSRLLETILSECMTIFYQSEKGFFLIKYNTNGKFHLDTVIGFSKDKIGSSLFTFEQLENIYIKPAKQFDQHVYIADFKDQNADHTFLSGLPKMDSTITLTIKVEDEIMALLIIENNTLINHFNEARIDSTIRLQRHIQNAIVKTSLFKRLKDSSNEIIKTQEKLVTQEKMAALGNLSAGVAHEINNPTNFVHVSTQNLNRELESLKNFFLDLVDESTDNDEVQKIFREKFKPIFSNLKTITDGTLRIKNIVKDLLLFSSNEHKTFESIPIEQCISSTLNLLQSNYSKVATFEERIMVNTIISCIPSQLNQVLMNIIINACDAISQRQKIEPDLEGRVIIETHEHQGKLCIRIIDNGYGMNKETRERLFEPFFTTKEVGEGTGLGLSIAYGIIEHHKGSIHVEPNHPKGTTFIIMIPLIHG